MELDPGCISMWTQYAEENELIINHCYGFWGSREVFEAKYFFSAFFRHCWPKFHHHWFSSLDYKLSVRHNLWLEDICYCLMIVFIILPRLWSASNESRVGILLNAIEPCILHNAWGHSSKKRDFSSSVMWRFGISSWTEHFLSFGLYVVIPSESGNKTDKSQTGREHLQKTCLGKIEAFIQSQQRSLDAQQ